MADIKLKKNSVKSNYSSRDCYDLSIIGAGISGLTTGIMWLKNRPETQVLIINKKWFNS